MSRSVGPFEAEVQRRERIQQVPRERGNLFFLKSAFVSLTGRGRPFFLGVGAHTRGMVFCREERYLPMPAVLRVYVGLLHSASTSSGYWFWRQVQIHAYIFMYRCIQFSRARVVVCGEGLVKAFPGLGGVASLLYGFCLFSLAAGDKRPAGEDGSR